MNDKLPEGWEVASIGTIAQISPRHARNLDPDLTVTFVPMTAVSESKWQLEVKEERQLGEVRTGYTHFGEGDVLFAKITPCMENGKAGIATRLRNGLGCGTTELHVLRPHDGIKPHYLYHFMHQEAFRKEAARNFTGTAGQARVPLEFVRNTQVPIPPTAEQRRIIDQLEAANEKIQTVQARLDNIPTIIKRFRQAVLNAACNGQLTAEWRASRAHNTSASDVVSRIRDRRRETARTPAEKRHVGEIYQQLERQEAEELPNGWVFVRLNKLCSSFDYGTSKKSEPAGTVPVLRMGNIQAGRIDWTNLAYTSDENEIANYSLTPNTVLFNRTNSPELVGKTGIYRGERPAIFAGYLIRINCEPELNPEYLNLCLNTTSAKDFCLNIKTDGVSQSNINAQKLGTFEAPFCTLTEQNEIVRRVQALLAIADRLEARHKKASAQVSQLTQAVLSKAFNGELVPTEAELARREGREYETAAQLLHRVKQSPNSTPRTRRTRVTR